MVQRLTQSVVVATSLFGDDGTAYARGTDTQECHRLYLEVMPLESVRWAKNDFSLRYIPAGQVMTRGNDEAMR